MKITPNYNYYSQITLKLFYPYWWKILLNRYNFKGWSLKNLTKCSAWKMFTKSVKNGNKNADIFFLCPWGKKWVVNHFSKPNSFRVMNFQKWSITDESWRLSVSYTFMNDSVIDHFWQFILCFEKWFTTHFSPHGHRKKMSAFYFHFLHFWWTFFMLNI